MDSNILRQAAIDDVIRWAAERGVVLSRDEAELVLDQLIAREIKSVVGGDKVELK